MGEIENVQEAAACVTSNVCPATVSVPLRGVVLAFVLALKFTVPLPLPLDPLVIVSQEEALLVAVQLQPPGAVTSVAPVPPDDPSD